MKSFTIGEINEVVKGSLTGNTTHRITGAEQLSLATQNHITFIGSKKYSLQWNSSKAAAALVDETLSIEPGENRALIRVKNADLAMARVLELFIPEPPVFDSAIHPSAVIHKTASIGEGCKIGAGAYIGANVIISGNVTIYPNVTILDECTIGMGTIIWPGTVIRERCIIGSFCILHPNVSIGTDGFGYCQGPDGKSIVKVPHIGIVKIGDNVEIGSGSCVDRGKFSATIIGDGTKLDNLVQIGHNCQIGRMCLLAGSSGLSGSVIMGDGVVLGGDAGVKDHVTIGSGAKIGIRSVVMNDIPAGEKVLGYPAVPYRDTLKQWAILKDLVKKSDR